MMKYSLAAALARIEKLSQMDEKTHKPHKNDIAQRDNINNIKAKSSNISYINNKQSSPSSAYPPDLEDALEHNLYNRSYLSNLQGLGDADNAKLWIDSNLAYSNKKNNSSNSNDSNYTPHNQHKTSGHYVGLKLRVNSDPTFLLAQQWGMLAKWLYILCRDYGEQTVKAKIEYVSAIADGYFGDAESIATQRGKMTTHLVRSCKPRRKYAQQKT